MGFMPQLQGQGERKGMGVEVVALVTQVATVFRGLGPVWEVLRMMRTGRVCMLATMHGGPSAWAHKCSHGFNGPCQ